MFLTPRSFQSESRASPTSMVAHNQDKASQGGVATFRVSVELLVENQEQRHGMSNPTKIMMKMTLMIPRTLKSQIPGGPRLIKRTLLFRERGAGAFPADTQRVASQSLLQRGTEIFKCSETPDRGLGGKATFRTEDDMNSKARVSVHKKGYPKPHRRQPPPLHIEITPSAEIKVPVKERRPTETIATLPNELFLRV
jgi:hypothetical protein